jgi:hypothetical protein
MPTSTFLDRIFANLIFVSVASGAQRTLQACLRRTAI